MSKTMGIVILGTIAVLTACGEAGEEAAVEAYGTARQAYTEVANRDVDLALNEALSRGDLASAADLIEQGADVDARYRGEGGITNLIVVSSVGEPDMVTFLLEHGADPDLRTDEGRTALMNAARLGHVHHVETLLAAGADPAIRDEAGKTARDHAREAGHDEVVAALERASAA